MKRTENWGWGFSIGQTSTVARKLITDLDLIHADDPEDKADLTVNATVLTTETDRLHLESN